MLRYRSVDCMIADNRKVAMRRPRRLTARASTGTQPRCLSSGTIPIRSATSNPAPQKSIR